MKLAKARWTILFLTIIGGGSLFFAEAGNLLVVEDRFPHAEMALILSGEAASRALAARDLYRAGKIDQILIIPDPPSPVNGELVKLGLVDPALPSLSERILTASGIPRAKIVFLPHPVDGTIEEALQVRRYFKGRSPHRLVVVTSRFASRRARFIFRQVLKDHNVEVLVVPTPYDSFKPDRWWLHPRNALHVVMEYLKFIPNGWTLLKNEFSGR